MDEQQDSSGLLPELPEGTTPEDVMRLVELAQAVSAELEALLIQRTTAKRL
jgi:hypothetical protein